MEEDLQKIDDVKNESNQEKFFKISKLVKPAIRENKPHYEVAWVGYRGNNTIELRDNLIKDVPKMVIYMKKEMVLSLELIKMVRFMYIPNQTHKRYSV